MKPKDNKNKRRKTHRLVLPALFVVQFIAICILAFYAYSAHQGLLALDGARIGNLIIDAVDGINKPLNTDPQTGRAYISEARLTLPPVSHPQSEFSQDMLFYYSPKSGPDFDEEVRLVDGLSVRIAKSDIYNARDMFEVFKATPKLQSCSRGYLIVFSELKETDVPKEFEKKLKDGRTAHVYLEKACADNKEETLPYIRQIESY